MLGSLSIQTNRLVCPKPTGVTTVMMILIKILFQFYVKGLGYLTKGLKKLSLFQTSNLPLIQNTKDKQSSSSWLISFYFIYSEMCLETALCLLVTLYLFTIYYVYCLLQIMVCIDNVICERLQEIKLYSNMNHPEKE